MIGATVMANREPIGHIEIVRAETRNNGEHIYRYGLYENGVVITYGAITHLESDGAYILLHKALTAILEDHLIDD